MEAIGITDCPASVKAAPDPKTATFLAQHTENTAISQTEFYCPAVQRKVLLHFQQDPQNGGERLWVTCLELIAGKCDIASQK